MVFLALLVILIVMFVIVPFVGLTLWLLISAVVTGLVMGALGRLIVPGRQAIGCLSTVVAGLVGSLGGTLLGHALGVHHIATLLIEIAISAGAVAVISRRTAGQLPAGPR